MREMSYNNSHNNSDFGNLGLFSGRKGFATLPKEIFKPIKFRSEVILEDWNLATRLNIIVELTSTQSGCHAKVSQQVI